MKDTPEDENRICPACENLLADGAEFCGRCGQDAKSAGTQKLQNYICPNCRIPFSSGPKTTHCSQCGGKLKTSFSIKFCKKCGHPIFNDAPFCGNCGLERTEEPLEKPQVQIESPDVKKNHREILVIMVIVIVVFAFLKSYENSVNSRQRRRAQEPHLYQYFEVPMQKGSGAGGQELPPVEGR